MKTILDAVGLLHTARSVKRGLSSISDLGMWLKFRLSGRSYADFYAARMDRLAIKFQDNVNGPPEKKRFHLEYLRSRGLREDQTVLDYGCGSLASGIHFIKYLESGKYCGADISNACVQLGAKRVKAAGLSYKAPKLIHIRDEHLNELGGLKFDFIWAQSVFTHMPPEDIQALLLRLRAHMHPHSVFYATIATTQGESHRSIVKDFYYNVQFFFDSAPQAGYACEVAHDWVPVSTVDRLLKFTLKSA